MTTETTEAPVAVAPPEPAGSGPAIVDRHHLYEELASIKARMEYRAAAPLRHVSEEVLRSIMRNGETVIVVFDRCFGIESQQGIRTVILSDNGVTVSVVTEAFAQQVRHAGSGTGTRDDKPLVTTPKPTRRELEPLAVIEIDEAEYRVWPDTSLVPRGFYLRSTAALTKYPEPVLVGPFSQLAFVDQFLTAREACTGHEGFMTAETIVSK